MKQKHSPLPWTFEKERGIIWNADKISVANIPIYRERAALDAEFICLTVNSYCDMQQALKSLVDAINLLDNNELTFDDVLVYKERAEKLLKP